MVELKNGEKIVACNYKDEDCNDYCCVHVPCRWNDKALKKLKEYEDLEEQGMLFKTPVRIGQQFWFVATAKGKEEPEIICDFVEDIYFQLHSITSLEYKIGNYFNSVLLKGIPFDCVGVHVFFTEKEAEAALKEMEK